VGSGALAGSALSSTRTAPLSWSVVAVTALLVFAGFFAVTLQQPYHLDTTAYFQGLSDWRDGRLTCPFATRCMVSYYLLPFSPLGAQAVRVGFVTAATLFFVLSYHLLSRTLSPCTAYVASLLVLATPAGVVNVTHLKEDFVGLLLVAAAAGLAIERATIARLASAIVFTCALLAKETFLVFTPFYASILACSIFVGDDEEPHARALAEPRRWLLLASALALTFVLTFLGKLDYVSELTWMTGSPHLGQFRGPFSSLLPSGFRMFQRGIGFAPLFWLQLAGIVAAIAERDRRRRVVLWIFVANGLLVAFFLMNITVMTYRHFVAVAFLTLPPATYALERLIGQRWVCLAIGVILVVLVARTLPFVALHAHYNPQQRLFAGLESVVGPDGVLLTMDYEGLARHYLGNATKQHTPDPDAAEAAAFVQSIRDDSGRPYYLLPDAIAYDAHGAFRSALDASFRLEPVYQDWFEDFHTLDYGRRPDEIAAELAQQTGCAVTCDVEGSEAIGALELDRYRFRATCGDGARSVTRVGMLGTIFPYLTKATVYRLVPRTDG
jgi:hypothetical protein